MFQDKCLIIVPIFVLLSFFLAATREGSSSLSLSFMTWHDMSVAATVRHRGMGTGISEASKRVPIFSFATQGGKQVSSYF